MEITDLGLLWRRLPDWTPSYGCPWIRSAPTEVSFPGHGPVEVTGLGWFGSHLTEPLVQACSLRGYPLVPVSPEVTDSGLLLQVSMMEFS